MIVYATSVGEKFSVWVICFEIVKTVTLPTVIVAPIKSTKRSLATPEKTSPSS